eukprot:Colp12_sorted_trinity150504_noHs@32622
MADSEAVLLYRVQQVEKDMVKMKEKNKEKRKEMTELFEKKISQQAAELSSLKAKVMQQERDMHGLDDAFAQLAAEVRSEEIPARFLAMINSMKERLQKLNGAVSQGIHAHNQVFEKVSTLEEQLDKMLAEAEKEAIIAKKQARPCQSMKSLFDRYHIQILHEQDKENNPPPNPKPTKTEKKNYKPIEVFMDIFEGNEDHDECPRIRWGSDDSVKVNAGLWELQLRRFLFTQAHLGSFKRAGSLQPYIKEAKGFLERWKNEANFQDDYEEWWSWPKAGFCTGPNWHECVRALTKRLKEEAEEETSVPRHKRKQPDTAATGAQKRRLCSD